MTTVGEILNWLEELAPLALAEEWDNVGLLAGRRGQTVNRVLCALDLTPSVLTEATEVGAELILTHHPILFRGRKNLCEEDAEGRLLCGLVRSGKALIAMHTNLDNAHPGVNDALAVRLGLSEVQGLEHGLCAGTLPSPTPLKTLAAQVEEALGGAVRMYGDGERKVSRIAVLGGSGGSFWPEAAAAGAEVYLTGEMGHHHALDALGEGLCALECGHAATETPAVQWLYERLEDKAQKADWKLEVLMSRTGQVC